MGPPYAGMLDHPIEIRKGEIQLYYHNGWNYLPSSDAQSRSKICGVLILRSSLVENGQSTSSTMVGTILCVGRVEVLLTHVMEDGLPKEDTKLRSLECHWNRGGNASNNCTVLSLLGAECEFLGTVAHNLFWRYAKENFDQYKINTSNCVMYGSSFEFPLSTVIVNNQTGTRTIIHSNKNLPDLSTEEFSKVDLSNYSWIHFEGRNPGELINTLQLAMMKVAAQDVKISVELEKPRDGYIELAKHAHVVFISKDFAQYHGWSDQDLAIEGMKKHILQGATIICPWGETGAAAYQADSGLVKAPCYPPPAVVDTLGAGDTFLAATIFYLSRGKALKTAIDFGCRMAGAKVGARGFDIVQEAFQDHENNEQS